MSLFRRIFDFYLDASIHVGLAVFCLVYVTSFFLGIPIDEHLGFYILFATIPCYNFIKYGVEAEKYIVVSNRYHRIIQFFSFGCLALALYHLYFLNLATWLGIGVLMILTGFYALPVLPAGRKLRNLGLLKVILVSAIWAGTTVILPLLAMSQGLSWDAFVELVQRGVLVLVLLLPFEIRDMNHDKAHLRTIPQRIGVSNTKLLGLILALVFFFLTFFKDELDGLEIIAKSFLFLMLLIMLLTSTKKQEPYYASFWVEAIPILWYGIIWLLAKNL